MTDKSDKKEAIQQSKSGCTIQKSTGYKEQVIEEDTVLLIV